MGTNVVVITGTGLFTPPYSISNAELAASLTIAVNRWNEEHGAEIEAGEPAGAGAAAAPAAADTEAMAEG